MPVIIGIVLWDKLPDKLPAHWNYKGEVDMYLHKILWMLMPTFVAVSVLIFFKLLPYVDPKNNYDFFRKTLYDILVVVSLFMLTIFTFIVLSTLGNYDPLTFILYAAAVLILLMGNFLGKLRPSFFLGIRTPWTLGNDSVWIKTHRFSGIWWVVLSFSALVIFPFSGSHIFKVFIAYVTLVMIIPFGYSFYSYMQNKKEK